MMIGAKKKKLLLALLLVFALQGTGRAEQSWKASFDNTCAGSNEAMTMSVEQLGSLLDTCAALERVLDKEEESVRKVYLKRLQMCKNLYAYVLDYKKNLQSAK